MHYYHVSATFNLAPVSLQEGNGGEARKLINKLHSKFDQDAGCCLVGDVYTLWFDGHLSDGDYNELINITKSLGKFSTEAAAVYCRADLGRHDSVFFVGPTDEAVKAAQVDYHLDQIKKHLHSLGLPAEDGTGKSGVDCVMKAIRNLTYVKNSLLIGYWPDTKQHGFYVLDGTVQNKSIECINEKLEGLEVVSVLNIHELFDLIGNLSNDPDIKCNHG